MTKELLSKRGIDFISLDVENEPDAMRQLRELGLKTVPVVAVGDRFVTGWNPTAVADLVGFELVERVASPTEQVELLLMLTDAMLRAVRQLPDDRLGMKSPDRDRPLWQLTQHVFRVIECAVDVDTTGRFPAQEWVSNYFFPERQRSADIARYGEAIRGKVAGWFAVIDDAAFARTIDADVGPRTYAQVMERTLSHAAQHLRQIYVFFEWIGIEPDQPLGPRELSSIQLPDSVW
jgi:hypothetical protein